MVPIYLRLSSLTTTPPHPMPIETSWWTWVRTRYALSLFISPISLSLSLSLSRTDMCACTSIYNAYLLYLGSLNTDGDSVLEYVFFVIYVKKRTKDLGSPTTNLRYPTLQPRPYICVSELGHHRFRKWLVACQGIRPLPTPMMTGNRTHFPLLKSNSWTNRCL